MFTIHLVSQQNPSNKILSLSSLAVLRARGKASSNLLPSQRLRLLPEVSKSTKRSGSSRLGRSLQTQISPWKWLSFQCDCRHLAALAPNHLAGPEGWAHSLDTDEIVDRNFARMCMVRWVKLVFQTNELTEEKQLTCPRSRCCVTERWGWYKLKLDPAKSSGWAQLVFLQGALNWPMRPSFEALPMGWTPVGPCSVGCRWCRWCWWICFCAFCIQNVDWQGAIILLQPVSAENIKNSQQCFVPCFSSYLSGVHGWAPIMFTCITHPNVAGCCRSHTSAWSGIDAIVTNCLSPSSPEGHQNTLGSHF